MLIFLFILLFSGIGETGCVMAPTPGLTIFWESGSSYSSHPTLVYFVVQTDHHIMHLPEKTRPLERVGSGEGSNTNTICSSGILLHENWEFLGMSAFINTMMFI